MEGKRLSDKHDRSIAVAIKNLSYSAIHRKTGKRFNVLNDVSFLAQPGQLVAIMGPSGCGKSTLLNMIAGRIPRSSMTSGDIFYNGVQKNIIPSKFSRYVMQHDHLLEYLTVDETLTMAARLKLKGHSPEERRCRVEAVMKELDLYDCRHTLVGGHTHKGISGGERKRVSIALELLEDPRLLFLDEPTTGLDSSRAFDTLQILISLARAGRTILCTVHSPRSPVFALFDQLVLLSKGNCVYFGPANNAINYFCGLGIGCPSWCSPPDFLLDLLSSSTERDEGLVLDSEEKMDSLSAVTPMIYKNEMWRGEEREDREDRDEERGRRLCIPEVGEKRGTELCSHQAEWSPSLMTTSNFSTVSLIDRYNDLSTEAFNSNPLKGKLRITPVRVSSVEHEMPKEDDVRSVDEQEPFQDNAVQDAERDKRAEGREDGRGEERREDKREGDANKHPNRFTSNFAFPSNFVSSNMIDTSKNEYLNQLESGTLNINAPNANPNNNQLSILSFQRDNSYGGFSNLSFQSQALKPLNDVRISLSPSEISKLPELWKNSSNNSILLKKIQQHLSKYSVDNSPQSRFSLFRGHMKTKSAHQAPSGEERREEKREERREERRGDEKSDVESNPVLSQKRIHSYTVVDAANEPDLSHRQPKVLEAYPSQAENPLAVSSATAATYQDILTSPSPAPMPASSPGASGIHLSLALPSPPQTSSPPPPQPPSNPNNESGLLSLIQFRRRQPQHTHENGLADLRKKHCEGHNTYILPFLKMYWWLLELSVLTYRLFLKDLRDIKALLGNIGQKLFSGFVLGVFFWQLGVHDMTAANNRMGLLFWLCLNTTIALHSVLAIFPSSRALINKEIANGMYSSSSYYVAQNLASLPIEHIGNNIFFTIVFFMSGLNNQGGRFLMFLIISNLLVFAITGIMTAISAFSSTVELANITASLFILLFVLVAGFYVHSDNIPKALRFLNSISYMRYAFISYLYNDVHDLHFTYSVSSSSGSVLGGTSVSGNGALYGDTNMDVSQQVLLDQYHQNNNQQQSYIDSGFQGDVLLERLAFQNYALYDTLPILFLLGIAYRIIGFFFFKFMHRRVGLEL